jgi:hypothetical protein
VNAFADEIFVLWFVFDGEKERWWVGTDLGVVFACEGVERRLVRWFPV